MTKLLPWVLVALAIVAGVIVYMLLTGGKQNAKVTMGGLTYPIDWDSVDDIFQGFL